MISTQQFGYLEVVYNFYNKELFNNELKDCFLNLSRKNRAAGFFIPGKWKNANTNLPQDEISINPDTFDLEDKYWHCTLVHEMAHLWQYQLGKPGRGGYHNKEWATKMESIGLMPSDTGKPGGKKTGDSMADYPIENGLFELAFNKLVTTSLPYVLNINEIIPVYGDEMNNDTQSTISVVKKKKKSGIKFKYQCTCGNNVWGKENLKLICFDCRNVFNQIS